MEAANWLTARKQAYGLFTANLWNGSWQTPWAAYGLETNTVAKPGVTMPVIVLIGDEAFAGERTNMFYTAKAGKSGTAK